MKPAAPPNKVASALAKAPADATAEDEDAEYAAGALEVRAIKAFDKAKTPEARAAALKTFIKACSSGGGE